MIWFILYVVIGILTILRMNSEAGDLPTSFILGLIWPFTLGIIFLMWVLPGNK